ncbi:hypothetical protein BP00DRAFT_153460 [Aspergillus indologenus CBS 114.80]|uniref:Uncharacterized protein n=1 Tax=Aspergillus indologenus CBS 114.80 TaxID=1450541 RepID=A0A2V5JBE3_9EURO|nr:hypothetical protein BP00DRAFT_153460 [Aspergillus indologenus CBS 114.80]
MMPLQPPTQAAPPHSRPGEPILTETIVCCPCRHRSRRSTMSSRSSTSLCASYARCEQILRIDSQGGGSAHARSPNFPTRVTPPTMGPAKRCGFCGRHGRLAAKGSVAWQILVQNLDSWHSITRHSLAFAVYGTYGVLYTGSGVLLTPPFVTEIAVYRPISPFPTITPQSSTSRRRLLKRGIQPQRGHFEAVKPQKWILPIYRPTNASTIERQRVRLPRWGCLPLTSRHQGDRSEIAHQSEEG